MSLPAQEQVKSVRTYVLDRSASRPRVLPAGDREASALVAEDAAREVGVVSLHEALQLVRLYAERGSPKYESAARRWLVRYLSEGTPSLKDVAKVTASLAKRLD